MIGLVRRAAQEDRFVAAMYAVALVLAAPLAVLAAVNAHWKVLLYAVALAGASLWVLTLLARCASLRRVTLSAFRARAGTTTEVDGDLLLDALEHLWDVAPQRRTEIEHAARQLGYAQRPGVSR